MGVSKEAKPHKIFLVSMFAYLAVPAALAQNVTVYGQAHVSVDRSDDGETSNTFTASNSSRLGFKGSEDLGNGLKAVFQLGVALFERSERHAVVSFHTPQGGASVAPHRHDIAIRIERNMVALVLLRHVVTPIVREVPAGT